MRRTVLSRGISVTEDIKTDILFAVHPPGEKLSVRALSERYGCGASPLREALNQLANEGWVVRIDKRGFFVASSSELEFRDILFNRCFMEAEALKRAMSLGGATWEEGIVVAHFRLTNLNRGQVGEGGVIDQKWEAAHKRFHMSLIAACGSEILLSNCEKLYDLNIRYRFLSGRLSYPQRRLVDEHNRIRDLVLARKTDEAIAALQSHYRETGRFLFGNTREEGESTHEKTLAG